MFYDRFIELCEEKKIKPTRACVEAGLSRGLAAKWKSTNTEKPSADALEKLSAYFEKPIEEILYGKIKKQSAPEDRQVINDDDLKVAYFRGADPTLTQEDMDAMWEDAKSFRDFIVERRKRERNGG